MARYMRCKEAYWAGNRFFPAGTVLPEGHPDVIAVFYEPMEVTEPVTGKDLGTAETPRRGRKAKTEES